MTRHDLSFLSLRSGKKLFFACLLLCAWMVSASADSFAQSLAGLGAISGSVEDAQGAGVGKASIEVVNATLGIDRKLTASEAGLFYVPSLPPADGYSVVVTMAGFGITKESGIVVHVGEDVAIPVVLKISGGNQVVTVDETSAAIVDVTRSEVSALVNQKQVANLPINGRRADQFTLLTPGVVQDGITGEVSFHGIPAGNEFLQDGVDITQQWFVGDAGGSAVLSNISMDAVQEFRTEVSGYSAEFGRSAGGVVNTLTKSGTNLFHASAFWYFRNRTLNAIDLFSKFEGAPFNAPEYRHQFGGTAGGPVVKNKLFFFSSYEGTIRNYPITSVISGFPTIVSQSGAILPGQCKASTLQCANLQALVSGFFRTVNRNFQQNAGFVKFDYRPSDRDTWTANFNLVNYSASHGGFSGVASTDGSGASGATYNIRTHLRNTRLSETHILSSTMVNEARFGFNADRRAQGLPTDLLTSTASGQSILSSVGVSGFLSTFGVSSNALPNTQPTEKRFNFVDTLSQSHGRHQLKYGLDLAYLRSIENGVLKGPGVYTYANLTNFAYDLTPDPGVDPGTPGEHYAGFAQAVGHPITRITIRDYDFFAQDQYQVTSSLLLNLGVRYEYSTYTQPPAPSYKATDPSVGPINQPRANFAPRIGFTYSFDNNKTLVRGNYGLFYNRLPGASITRLQQLGGIARLSFSGLTPSSNGAVVFPNRYIDVEQAQSILNPGQINSGFAKPGLATPYVQEWSLGVERALSRNLSATITYVGSRGIKFLERSDLNIGNPTGSDTYTLLDVNGNATGKTYTTPTYLLAAKINPNYGQLLQIDNAGRIWYDGMLAELHQRESKYIQSTVAYTFSHAEDLGQGAASNQYYFSDTGNTYFNGSSIINGKTGYSYEKGHSLEDQRHRLVLTALLNAPPVQKGQEWVKQAANGWQLAPIFTYATPQSIDSTESVSSTDHRLYNPSPTNGYSLSGMDNETPNGPRVPFLPTNNLPLGHTVQLDARLSKRFDVRESGKLELGFEAINSLNHIRYTSVNQKAYVANWNNTTETGTLQAQPAGFTSTGASGYGAGTASGGFPDGTNARRAQAFLRFTF